MMLLKANLLTGLFLAVDNLSIVMIQKRWKTSYLSIIGLQEVVVDMLVTMKEMVMISN